MTRCRPRKIYQGQLNFTVHRRTHREGSDTAPTRRQTHCKSTPHPSFNLMFRKIQNVLVREPSLSPRAVPLLSQTSTLAVGPKTQTRMLGSMLREALPHQFSAIRRVPIATVPNQAEWHYVLVSRRMTMDTQQRRRP